MKPVNLSRSDIGGDDRTKGWKNEKQVKKREAYKSFSGLKNIFVDKDLCESYSFWPPKSQSGHKTTSGQKTTMYQNATSDQKTTPDQKTSSDQKTTSDQKTSSEYDATLEQDTQENLTEIGDRKSSESFDDKDEEIVLEISGDANSVDNEFTEGLANFISEALATSIPLVDPNDNTFHPTEDVINAYYESFLADNNDSMADSVPVDFSSSISPSLNVAETLSSRKSFVTPYISKKNCSCDKCLMPKCGSCYNCLNKRKTR